MTTPTATQPLTLTQFLQRDDIEESPAWEYIKGEAVQKPMPQGRHNRLQIKLCEAINRVAEPLTLAYALPELRCNFGDRSIVSDIAVLRWSNIPLTPDGEMGDQFRAAPNWTIEILSPGQSMTQVVNNIDYCLQQGTELGWLLEPNRREISVFKPRQELLICQGEDRLPVLAELPLELNVNQVFGWLKIQAKS
jgi:Uma2 family endonuclease